MWRSRPVGGRSVGARAHARRTDGRPSPTNTPTPRLAWSLLLSVAMFNKTLLPTLFAGLSLGLIAGACQINDNDNGDDEVEACMSDCSDVLAKCEGECDDDDNECVATCEVDADSCEEEC